MNAPPCKGCEKRMPKCHATCKAYMDWCTKRRMVKNDMRKFDGLYAEFRDDQAVKRIRRKHEQR